MFSKQLNQSNSVAFFVRNIEMSDVAPSQIVAAFRHVTALTGVSPRELKTRPDSAVPCRTAPSLGV